MLPDLGDIVYEIRNGDHHWVGVGGKATVTPRAGFPVPHLPTEWLTVTVHVTDLNPAEIPAKNLSVFKDGETCLGDEGGWRVVHCLPAGNLRIVELTTRR